MAETLSEQMLRENAGVFSAMTGHRFIRDIEADRLAPEVFERYLVYEGAFVETAIAIFAHAVAKAESMAQKRWLIGVLDALANEQIAYFEKTFADRGIDPGRFDPGRPEVEAFRAGMLAIAENGGYLDIVAAMFAAEWMYWTWSKAAAAHAMSDPLLAEWVALHALEDFAAQARWLRDELDAAGEDIDAAERARLSAIFGRVQALEIVFHNAAYLPDGERADAQRADAERVVPGWSYRPGPDVADTPPPDLVAAQRIARGAAAAGLSALAEGVSEQEIDLAVSAYLRAQGVDRVWTITNVGLGENARTCFPTNPPSGLRATARDVLMLDVHPVTPAGSWGDCTRCRVLGDWSEAESALVDLEALHHEALGKCRPGMPASELFGLVHARLVAEGFVLLDQLANIGHSLGAGAAYLQNFIDAGNDAPMWGAWAIEPFAARGDIAVKVEDLVWFGRERCTVL